MHTQVLLIDGGTVSIALVAIVAIVVVALAVADLLFFVLRDRSKPVRHEVSAVLDAPRLTAPPPRSLPHLEVVEVLKDLEIDVPTRHADKVLGALRNAGWHALDTGATVATDEGEEELTTLRVDIPITGTLDGGPAEVLAAATAAMRPGSSPPRRVPTDTGDAPVHVQGDLVVEDGYETQGDLSATGNILVGSRARVGGRVRAGGAIRLRRDAVIGTAICGQELFLEEGARVTGTVEAARGIKMLP